MSETDGSIVFKPLKGRTRQLRRRQPASDDDDGEKDEGGRDVDKDEDINRDKLQETLELQKLRQRSNGVSHVTLAVGRKVSKMDEIASAAAADPFKIKSGGLLTLSTARRAARAAQDSDSVSDSGGGGFGGGGGGGDKDREEGEVVGTQFSKETQVRDEDEEMRKFIEKEMEKRRRGPEEEDGSSASAAGGGGASKYLSPEDRALMSLPDHLRKSTFKKNEEMLSSQMLSGIPEVDLGIEEKIRNIEATEDAKKKLQAEQERRRGQQKSTDFTPTNLSVNFKRPNRFREDVDEDLRASDAKKAAVKESKPVMVVAQRTVVVGDVPMEKIIPVGETIHSVGGGGGREDSLRATDDLHLIKFKQHFHRK